MLSRRVDCAYQRGGGAVCLVPLAFVSVTAGQSGRSPKLDPGNSMLTESDEFSAFDQFAVTGPQAAEHPPPGTPLRRATAVG